MHKVGRYYAAVRILDDNSSGRQYVNIVPKKKKIVRCKEKKNKILYRRTGY